MRRHISSLLAFFVAGEIFVKSDWKACLRSSDEAADGSATPNSRKSVARKVLLHEGQEAEFSKWEYVQSVGVGKQFVSGQDVSWCVVWSGDANTGFEDHISRIVWIYSHLFVLTFTEYTITSTNKHGSGERS